MVGKPVNRQGVGVNYRYYGLLPQATTVLHAILAARQSRISRGCGPGLEPEGTSLDLGRWLDMGSSGVIVPLHYIVRQRFGTRLAIEVLKR
jgi:hypothetical protein